TDLACRFSFSPLSPSLSLRGAQGGRSTTGRSTLFPVVLLPARDGPWRADRATNTRSGYLSPRPPLPRDVHVRPRHVRDKIVARRKQAEPRKRRREGVVANFLGPVDLGEEIATQARRLHARYATGPSPHTFFPFGGGVRRCLGAAFATYEMKVVLAEVLSRAELRVAPGYRPHVVRRAVKQAASDVLPVVLVARSACGRCQRPEVEEAARRGFSTGVSLPSAARRSA